MKIETIKSGNVEIAAVYSDDVVLTDVSSALDLMMSVKYETGSNRIVINKAAVCKDFFILSTCLAGEVLQKFINYGIKFAVYGDFSGYTSKPLRDFMYESNQGHDVFFAADREEAVKYLAQA